MNILPAIITAILLVQSVASAEEKQQPNVLFITSDDLGLQLSCYGDTVLETPHLDALAASGVQFDIAYVAQASCSPTRSAMFAGLYPHENGQYGLTATRTALHPHLHDATLPNILKRAGYRTGIIGKLHVAPGNSFKFDYNKQSHMDAWEFHNLAGKAEYAETEQRLKAALKAWRHATDDPALDPAFHDQITQKSTNRRKRK